MWTVWPGRYRGGMTPQKLVASAGLALVLGSVIAGIAAAVVVGSEVPLWAKALFVTGVAVLIVSSFLKPKQDVPKQDVTKS